MQATFESAQQRISQADEGRAQFRRKWEANRMYTEDLEATNTRCFAGSGERRDLNGGIHLVCSPSCPRCQRAAHSPMCRLLLRNHELVRAYWPLMSHLREVEAHNKALEASHHASLAARDQLAKQVGRSCCCCCCCCCSNAMSLKGG